MDFLGLEMFGTGRMIRFWRKNESGEYLPSVLLQARWLHLHLKPIFLQLSMMVLLVGTINPQVTRGLLAVYLQDFFLAGEAKFWHDLLEILLEMKNIRRVNVKAKTLEVQRGEVEMYERVSERPVIMPLEAKPQIKEDIPSLNRIKKLHPKLRDEVELIYRELIKQRIPLRITDTLRTFEEQEQLYAIGRTKPGKIVTKANPGQSYHNYGLAVDFCLLTNQGGEASWNRAADLNINQKSDWDEIVSLFKHYGWEWGGDWASFKDYPHLQKTFGYSTADLLKMHNSHKIDSNGYVII